MSANACSRSRSLSALQNLSSAGCLPLAYTRIIIQQVKLTDNRFQPLARRPRLQVAQADARMGPAAVLSGPVKTMFKRAVRHLPGVGRHFRCMTV